MRSPPAFLKTSSSTLAGLLIDSSALARGLLGNYESCGKVVCKLGGRKEDCQMTRIYFRLIAFLASAYLLLPDLILAAGEKADMLVVVADSRRVTWSVSRFFVDVYNTNPLMFGVYCIILTAFLGGTLGFITDFIMKRTGIDLTSRKIVEH
jgi:hypothetical protein